MKQSDYDIYYGLVYVGLLTSTYNLGGHNALLEAAYDPWARNELLSPLPTLCGPTGSHTHRMHRKPTLRPKFGI